ncbi:MAG: coproporphyrinogen dehydrogenase HemZ [Acetatifactor sp.]
MFAIEINRENYEYDIQALVKSFYPEEQVAVLIPESRADKRAELEDKVRIRLNIEENGATLSVDGRDYHFEQPEGEDYKGSLKRFLYKVLCQETGKELPWGNLIGIRPTKIAYGLLEEGKSREEIVEHYRREHYTSTEKAELAVDIAQRERALLADVHYQGGYSLYVGIPFCPTTCLYCSFTSYPIGGYRKQVDAYVDCVIKEMEFVADRYRDKILDSVYVGGGTPTTLEPEQLDRMISRLKELFDFSNVKEFTVEAGRADSITEEKLRVLYRHGVTRISVNPQTMKQETLDLIGRKATVVQVEEAFALARRIGFDNINMDLILGLPGETEEDVQRTVDRVVELAPDSLTVHSLAIKRASRLNQWIQENGVSMLRNTDETMKIAAKGAEKLGLVPYYLYRQKNMSGNFENVGYAREGKLGLYNILIMEEKQTIVACGAGSITKRVFPDGRLERCENVKDVASFIERIDEMIERKRRLFED